MSIASSIKRGDYVEDQEMIELPLSSAKQVDAL